MRLLSGAIPYIPVIQQGDVNFAMSYNIIIYIIIYIFLFFYIYMLTYFYNFDILFTNRKHNKKM
jgi:hypothetical protein